MPISPFASSTRSDGNPRIPDEAYNQLPWDTRLQLRDPRINQGWREAVKSGLDAITGRHTQPDAPFQGIIPLDDNSKLGGDHLIRPEHMNKLHMRPPVTQEEGKKGEHYLPNMLDWFSHFGRKLLPQGDK